jgi:hypothetical protein
MFNELMHSGYRRFADSSEDRARQGGCLQSGPFEDRSFCNLIGSDGSCGFPGATSTRETQAGGSGGFTAAIGLGTATDIGPVRSTDGACAIMQSICLVGGPIAGYSADLTILNVSAGTPSDGWSFSLINKAAIPIGGYSLSPGYGSDGLSFQAARSFGAIYGWGAKVCIQQKVSSCTGN